MFDNFLGQTKPEQIITYNDLFEEVKSFLQDENERVKKEECKVVVEPQKQELIVPDQNLNAVREPVQVGLIVKDEVKPEEKVLTPMIEVKKEESKLPEIETKKEQVQVQEAEQQQQIPVLIPSMEEVQKQEPQKHCLRIMTEYLCSMATKVSEKFFVSLILFIRYYSDYMNLHGWEILGKHKPITEEEKKKQFTKTRDAEHVPEACNDFMKVHLPKECPNFDQTIGIDMTLHICDWLYRQGYTHTRITPI